MAAGNWFARLPTAGKGAVIVGGLASAVLLYKHFKNASATAAGTPTATAGTSGCPSGYMDDGTGTGNCIPVGSYASGSGGGYGGGGGGGDGGLGSQILTALQGIQSSLSSQPVTSGTTTNNPTTPGDGSGTVATTSASTGTAPVSASSVQTQPGYMAPISSIFSQVGFTPASTITYGGHTYYGISNAQKATELRQHGLDVVGGKTVQGGNPSANYVRV